MIWKTIRLELAKTRGFPTGSVSRGYLIRAPIDETGRIDADALAANPDRATVRRFWSTDPDERGHVLRADGHWALRCNGSPDRLLPLSSHLRRVGGQVTVTDADGAALPFRIASVRQLG